MRYKFPWKFAIYAIACDITSTRYALRAFSVGYAFYVPKNNLPCEREVDFAKQKTEGFITKTKYLSEIIFLMNPPVTDYAVTSPFHKGMKG